MDYRVCAGALYLVLTAGSGWAKADSCRLVDGPGQVGYCERSVAGSKFHEYSASGTLCASISEVVTLLTSVEAIPDWFPDVLEARALNDDADEPIVYLKNRAPWPLSPRDMVYHFSLESVGPDGSVRVRILGIPDFAPPVPKVVRMEAARGSWSLKPAADRTDVEFSMHLELGDVPLFLANRRVQATVLEAVRNLVDRFACG